MRGSRSASGVNRGYVPSAALGNRSCPRDLARLTAMALREPRIARVARRATARVRFGRQPRRTLTTTNPLLAAGDPGVIGLKTGTSIPAGRCLIAVARRGGRTLAVIVLDSADPAADARRLLAAAG
jgi:D-alanyl-D-alanine carboxypeptidase (penicillin-binding protein 5/6)